MEGSVDKNTLTQDKIAVYKIRPRFAVHSPLSMEELSDKINAALEGPNATCVGWVKRGWGHIYIPPADRHYWSPQLNLQIEEEKEGVTLNGVYGPRPTVWTMFVFIYTLIGFFLLITSMVGLSYYTLDKPLTILWIIPGLLILFVTMYFVSYSGQKIGKPQMEVLHRFISEATGLEI